MSDTLIETSKRTWTTNNSTIQDIQTGCLQRIAAATELMAKNHAELIRERDLYVSLHRDELQRRRKRDRHISALRGVITKLKRQLAAKKGGTQ